jgi:ABC-2 type transport system permease protein
MTSLPATAQAAPPEGTPLARAAGLLTAEWVKLRTARSGYLMIPAAAAAALFVATGLADLNVTNLPPHVSVVNAADVVGIGFKGFAIAQLIMAVFGALAITGEYGSGLIRTTFTAKPQRGAVFAAKLAVTGTVALAAGLAIAFACFLSTETIFGQHVHLSLLTPGALPAVLGGGFYLMVVALLGLGIGTMVRHTAGAITTVVAFLYLVPEIGVALPYPWNWDFANVFPSTAAQQITELSISPHSHALQAGPAYALLAGYALLIPCAAAWLLRRRDA